MGKAKVNDEAIALQREELRAVPVVGDADDERVAAVAHLRSEAEFNWGEGHRALMAAADVLERGYHRR